MSQYEQIAAAVRRIGICTAPDLMPCFPQMSHLAIISALRYASKRGLITRLGSAGALHLYGAVD